MVLTVIAVIAALSLAVCLWQNYQLNYLIRTQETERKWLTRVIVAKNLPQATYATQVEKSPVPTVQDHEGFIQSYEDQIKKAPEAPEAPDANDRATTTDPERWAGVDADGHSGIV